jgi:hypothetical protein
MHELNVQEIDEVSGAGFFRDLGYWLARGIQASRMPEDEWIWVN